MSILELLELSFRRPKASLLSIVAALVLDLGITSSGCSSVKLWIVAGGDNGVSTCSFTALFCIASPEPSGIPCPTFGIAKSRTFDVVFLGISCGILGSYLGCRCGMVVSEEYV